MNLFVNDIATLLRLSAASPNEVKTLVRLLSIDVLTSLGEGRYQLQADSQTLNAKSDTPLQVGAKYWAQLNLQKNGTPQLSHPVLQPKILHMLKNLPLSFDAKNLNSLFQSDDPFKQIKNTFVQHLMQSSSQEQFLQISNLLVPLLHNTFMIPLRYEESFGFFQIKKRYNKKKKRSVIDFYAAFAKLGPIGGVLSLIEGEVFVELAVAFEATRSFLEKHLNDLHYNVTLHLQENIEPLHSTEALLDTSA
jgi:hypothetical protein